MRERYIAFDVETPNYANDRMSAIGVAVVERGGIADAFDTLVNPETHFDRFNVDGHLAGARRGRAGVPGGRGGAGAADGQRFARGPQRAV